MEIKANTKGSRYIEVSEEHLETIKKYSLFTDLVDSSGYVDDTTLEKLRHNVRALLEATEEQDKSLLDVCFDVIYHRDMKPVGLRNLLLLYISYYNSDEQDLSGFSAEELLKDAGEEEE
ncbi:MAG: hypothetical protein LUC22_02155 [Prevotella sp.]|nr:hypothetical protein [Prevotella sp.]